jgi:replicative DNA helicase
MKTINKEKEVIGSLIATPDLYLSVSDVLTTECFTDSNCKDVFIALSSMVNSSRKVSMTTLGDQITKNGSNALLTDFVGSLNAGDAFQEHCLILKEQEIKRMHIDLGLRLTALGSDDREDAFNTNDLLMNEAERIANSTGIGSEMTNSQYLHEVEEMINKASTTDGITGIGTGFTELDDLFSGRQNSDLIIRAARPGMGKTAMTLCEALFMALNEDKKVIFFSLEMSGTQLFQRLVSVHTGIDLRKIKRGELNSDDWDNYHAKVDQLKTDNIRIVDNLFTLNLIRTKARKVKMQHGLDVIFIDYLQLISHKVDKGRSKENEVSEISRSLKMLAKALDVPVICLSQLSRAVEQRGGTKVPMLSDLRDSGAIEQDADVVEFIYRPDAYDKDAKDEDGNSLEGVALIIVAKHRSGACGDVELFFNKRLTRFENKRELQQYVEQPPSKMKPSQSFNLEDENDGDVF